VRRINGEEENYFKRKYDIEPKIWGMSLSKLDASTKIGILIAIVSMIASFFYFGTIRVINSSLAYKKLFTKRESVLEAAKNIKRKKKASKHKAD
jgi:Na+-transporting NADH:ubiquinone oxidoreductase subunit NqrC